MCGIVGITQSNPQLIRRMNDSLRHRGPDAHQIYNNHHVSLGHRRLSILDLSSNGNQPMKDRHQIIVFNGEIYNYLEIKKLLLAKKYRFRTTTDTEVVLHAFQEWGPNCVKRFNGMWAFAIYDQRQKKLFLSRDHFGIKPLYYIHHNHHFAFASEIQALRIAFPDQQLDLHALNFYFYQKYIGSNRSIYQNIKQLLPAENLTYDLNSHQLTRTRYFDLRQQVQDQQKTSVTDRVSQAHTLLQDSIRQQLIADVPVGCFLSGGLDSSLLAAMSKRINPQINTFSIGFPQSSYDESSYAKQVAKYISTKHHPYTLDITDNLIEKALSILGQPFADPSLISTYYLAKQTRQHVTVALSGDGADEVFGGYDTYLGYQIAQYLPPFAPPILKTLVNLLPDQDAKVTLEFKLKRFLSTQTLSLSQRHFDWMATFPEPNRQQLLNQNFLFQTEFLPHTTANSLTEIQLLDFQYYLAENILKKLDFATMAHSLEGRVPFLDYRLVPLILSLPNKYKIQYFSTKSLLKTIAHDYLPASIIHRSKRGFSLPIASLIRTSPLIQEYLINTLYYQHGLLDFKYANSLYQQHIRHQQNHARMLWLIFVFNYWYHNTYVQ